MNSDEGDDPDLRAAIAASLREFGGSKHSSVPSGRKRNVVDLTGDSDLDDDELLPPGSSSPKAESLVGSETDVEGEVEEPKMRCGNNSPLLVGSETDVEEEVEEPKRTDRAPSLIGSDTDAEQGPPKEITERAQSLIESKETHEDIGGSEDEDLKKAIQLSMQEYTEGENEQGQDSTDTKNGAEEASSAQPVGMLGLDRKQMEQERLARLAKRKAAEPDVIPATKVPRIDDAMAEATAPRQGQPSETPGVIFPNGTVKKTWVEGYRRVGDDIKIEEVFQSADLELAVLSSYIWDLEWILSKMDDTMTQIVMMVPGSTKERNQVSAVDADGMQNSRG